MLKEASARFYFVGGLAVIIALFALGCAAAKYREAADKEVYQILSERHEHVFGQPHNYSIDTEYSKRKPTDVNGSELILDRARGSKVRLITLPEALEIAVKSNRSYQDNREELYKKALSLTETRHNFSFQFTSASADIGIKRNSDGTQDPATSSANIGLTKKIWKTGGQITASLANDLVLYINGKPKVPDLTLKLTQPLLRGAGADVAAEVLKLAERQVVYQVRDFSHYQKTFALNVVNDYLDLLQQADSMRISYNSYTNSIFFRTEIEARADAGLLAEFDVKQAKKDEYDAKLSYIGSTNSFQNSLDNFKQELSLPQGTSIQLDFKVLEEINKLGLPQVPIDDLTGYSMAITNRLDYLNHIDRFEDAKRSVKVARNSLLPGLNFEAEAKLKDQLYDSFDPNEYDSTIKLKLDLPISKVSERNAYRKSIITFEKQLRALATQLDTLRKGVRADVRNLARQRAYYYTQLAKQKNAEENLLATRERLRLGFPGVRTQDIIRARNSLTSAQQAVSRAIVDYHKTRLKLRKDVGILDTTQEEFWLKTDATSGGQPDPAPDQQDQEVIPPNQILGD